MAFQIVVILAGLVAGWVRKGSIWSITEIRLKWLWVLPVAYILQHISIAYLTGEVYQIVLVLSYLALMLFCAANLRTPGVVWTFVGTALNFLVMMVNHLRMPAYLPTVRAMDPSTVPLLLQGDYGKSIAMSASTHWNFLGDIFYFEVQPASLISIGDIVFSIGLVILIHYAMRLKRSEATDAVAHRA